MPLPLADKHAKPLPELNSQWMKRRLEMEARCERKWLFEPEKCVLHENPKEVLRLQRAMKEVLNVLKPEHKILDLGCGYGLLSTRLAKMGYQVTGIDIAKNALKKVTGHPNLTLIQQALPKTNLADDAFDVILALDLVMELHPLDWRLLLSEIARLLKTRGLVIFSTPLDTTTEEPFNHLQKLLETEFLIQKAVFSHHWLYNKLPILKGKIIHKLEAVTRFLFPSRGMSDVICVLKQKPMDWQEKTGDDFRRQVRF